MSVRSVVLALALGVALAVAGGVARPASGATTLGPGPGLTAARTVVIGHSVLGRRITAYRVGDIDSPRKALIVGNIHGDEPQGLRVIRAIRSMRARIHGVDLWVIDTVNPDGLRAGRRQNTRGVDLNRNFGVHWRRTGPPGSRYYAGRRAFTEPESRAVRSLVLRLRPAVTIWYHQPFGYVIPPDARGDAAVARTYGRLTGNAVHNPPGKTYTGTASMFENATVAGSTAFVVELPALALPARRIARHARAAVAVAKLGRSAARR
jgi:protein MpaA